MTIYYIDCAFNWNAVTLPDGTYHADVALVVANGYTGYSMASFAKINVDNQLRAMVYDNTDPPVSSAAETTTISDVTISFLSSDTREPPPVPAKQTIPLASKPEAYSTAYGFLPCWSGRAHSFTLPQGRWEMTVEFSVTRDGTTKKYHRDPEVIVGTSGQ